MTTKPMLRCEFHRWQATGSEALADNISALRLSYLQRNGKSAAAAASAVYYITVSAVATSYNNIAVTYHNTVKPRSFP